MLGVKRIFNDERISDLYFFPLPIGPRATEVAS